LFNKESSELALIKKNKGFRFSDKWISWILILPCIIVIFMLSLYPLFFAISESTRYHVLSDPMNQKFIGADNYRKALNDYQVSTATKRTILFTGEALILELLLGLIIALFLNKKFFGQGIVKALLFIPMSCSPLAIGLIWRTMYHPEFGVITFFANFLGFEGTNFLGNRATAMNSLVVFEVWQWAPFVGILILAGLASLSREPFEAAAVDGASKWAIFSRITFPMLVPIIFIAFLLRLLDLIRYYDGIYALTMGGPGTATETLTWFLYKIGFKYMDMGYSAAVAIIFLFIVVILSILSIKQVAKYCN